MSEVNRSNESLSWADFMSLGTVLLGVRLVQGWVYWGGGSRRFIYATDKLDPSSHAYMANKLNHAMPGAIMGLESVISWLLLHPGLLFFSILLFTTAEFFVGLGLLFGLATRFFAGISLILSVSLMLIFGWLGSTCLDEWTMAACSFGMGLSLLLAGGGHYSLDCWLADRNPWLKMKRWFLCFFSGPITHRSLKRVGLYFGLASFLFTAGFYSYLHGAVFGPLAHRTSPVKHNISLSRVHVEKDSLAFQAYVDAGPDTQGAFITELQVRQHATGKVLSRWRCEDLSRMVGQSGVVRNAYPFSEFTKTHCGFMGDVGAKAAFHIPLPKNVSSNAVDFEVVFLGIQGRKWVTGS